nr:ATP-binding protein [Cupriavidus sp.]
MRQEVAPAIGKLGALVVMADLWGKPDEDPADVVIGAVQKVLDANESIVARFAHAVGLKGVGFGGVSLDIDVGGGQEKRGGLWVYRSMEALSARTRRPIILIIDEAQQLLATERGDSMLYTLKATRDLLNGDPGLYGLRTVFTGSDRTKLLMMLGGRHTMYSASRFAFPALGADFLHWVRSKYDLPDSVGDALLESMFERAEGRPEVLMDAALQVALYAPFDEAGVTHAFEWAVDIHLAKVHQPFLKSMDSLDPIDDAVLRVVAADPTTIAGFDKGTMGLYRTVVQELDPEWNRVPKRRDIEQSLKRLTALKLMWGSVLGIHMLADPTLAGAMRRAGLLDIVPEHPNRRRYDADDDLRQFVGRMPLARAHAADDASSECLVPTDA